jgi:toxin ParE1/3/4
MNQQLEEVLEEVRALPDARQQEAAQVLLAFLDQQNPNLYLAPEEAADVERYVAENGPYASDEEVRTVFARLTKCEMRLRWDARALMGVEAIFALMFREDQAAAKLFVDGIEEATGRLLTIPKSGRRSAVEGMRLLAVPGQPYIIVYRVRGEIVDIVTLIYTAERKRENGREGVEVETGQRPQAARRRAKNRGTARSRS